MRRRVSRRSMPGVYVGASKASSRDAPSGGISPEKKCLQFVSGSRGNPEQGMVQKIAEESGGR